MDTGKIVIVLDHPDESRNVGAACRAMANNDIRILRIVGKKDNYDIEKVHTLAIHASYIFDNAEFFDSITEATADCVLSAGTTRRRGAKRKGKLLLPEEFAAKAGEITSSDFVAMDNREITSSDFVVADNQEIASSDFVVADNREIISSDFVAADNTENAIDFSSEKPDSQNVGGRVAIVFGNERSGLSDEQLKECTLGVTIPSSNDFGSLNLSHAVQIMCYHIFRENKKGVTGYTPLTLDRLDKTVDIIANNLQKIGFFKVAGREDMELFWRSILARAALSEGEAQYLEKVFTKANGLIGKAVGRG